jgi:hypothetical protein
MSERDSVMAEEMLCLPDWPDAGDELMSNYDHEVNHDIAEKLRTGEFTADYPAWNFRATCWFQRGQFHARVKRHKVVQGIWSADTPEKLMAAISSEFGYE